MCDSLKSTSSDHYIEHFFVLAEYSRDIEKLKECGMSKRNTTDIENTTDISEVVPKATKRTRKTTAEKTADGGTVKKRVSRKATAQTAMETARNVAVAEHEDPELQSLLLQVDTMLTEMTQSKWLSSDWPSLEIDFGNSKK